MKMFLKNKFQSLRRRLLRLADGPVCARVSLSLQIAGRGHPVGLLMPDNQRRHLALPRLLLSQRRRLLPLRNSIQRTFPPLMTPCLGPHGLPCQTMGLMLRVPVTLVDPRRVSFLTLLRENFQPRGAELIILLRCVAF